MNLISPLDRQTPDTLRRELADIESRIKKIIGDDPNKYFFSRHSTESLATIRKLLFQRKECLNGLFIGDTREMSRLCNLNNALIEMNDKLVQIMHQLEQRANISPRDNYEIVGHISPAFDYYLDRDCCPMISFDDDFYGSDFPYICFVIDMIDREDMENFQSIVSQTSYEYIVEWDYDIDPIKHRSARLDEEPALDYFLQQPFVKLLGLKFPLTHALIYTNYSIPDLVRIERFTIERRLRHTIHVRIKDPAEDKYPSSKSYYKL